MSHSSTVSLGFRPAREIQCVQFSGGGFIPIPKNASTTILRPLWRKHPGTAKDYRTADSLAGHIVAMFRHPTERAWSTYLQYRRPSRGAITADHPEYNWHPDPRLSWDRWLQAIAIGGPTRPLWDGYILPQVWFLKGMAVDIVPWDFQAIEEKLHIRLGHDNKRQVDQSTPDITREMQYHLELIYSADYNIWEQIRCK